MGFNAKTNLHAELARLRTVIHTERAVSPESQQSLVHSHLLGSVPIEMEHTLEVVLYDHDSLHVVSSVWHWGLCPSGYISRAVRLSIVKSEECEWLDDFGLGVNLFSCVQIYLMPMYSTEPYGLW